MSDFQIGLLSNIGMIAFVALSAYLLLISGSISFGQQAYFGIGAYAAGVATALWEWPLAVALGFGVLLGGLAGALVGLLTRKLSVSPWICGIISGRSVVSSLDPTGRTASTAFAAPSRRDGIPRPS